MNSRPALKLKISNKNRGTASIEVIQITDLHFLPDPRQTLLGIDTDETARQVIELAKVKIWPPDLILLTGDLAQDPLADTYRRLHRYLQHLDVRCVCLPGNHDDPRIMQEVLNSEKVDCSPRVLTDAWQIICLDSSEPGSEVGHFSEKTFRVLKQYLNEYPEKFVLICLHHHPIPIGCAWLDTMVLEEKNELFAILESYPKTRAIVCGHIHQALDTRHRNIQVFGTPSTCFQFKPASENFRLDDKAPGYRRLMLFPDGTIETEVFRLAELPKGLNLSSSGYRN